MLSVKSVNIEVSHVDSPNSFWAQYDEEEYRDMLGGIEHEVGSSRDHVLKFGSSILHQG